MRLIVATFLFLSFLSATAQNDTTFFNHDWKKSQSRKDAEFFRLAEEDTVTKLIHTTDFYITGEKYRIASYKSIKPEIKEGLSVWYRKSGIKLKEAFYRDNLLNGTFVEYRDNGHIASILRFKSGKMVSRDYFSIDGAPILSYIPMNEIAESDFGKYDKAELTEYANKNIEWVLKNVTSPQQPEITKYTVNLIEKGLKMNIMLDKKLYNEMLKDKTYQNNSFITSIMVLGAAQYQLAETGKIDLQKHKEATALSAIKAYKAYLKINPENRSKSLDKYVKLEKAGKLEF